MKPRQPLFAIAVVLALAGAPAWSQPTVYLSPDVPTDPDGPPVYLPWEVVRHEHLTAVPFALRR